ncbi:MAG: hypothetical protein C0485_10325 [Pirellula sp.]|nr:hypothetical protein [Pirellula sp.]
MVRDGTAPLAGWNTDTLAATLAAMLKALRYALATICFAASVGCLTLWWRSMSTWDGMHGDSFLITGRFLNLQSFSGTMEVDLLSKAFFKQHSPTVPLTWARASNNVTLKHENFEPIRVEYGSFGTLSDMVFFPIWYPALIFALAGVASLRFGRRFTLRSALIAMTVVIGLLGMAVAL